MNDGKIDRKLFEQKLVSTALPKYLKFMSSNCLCCFDKKVQTFYFFKVSESIDDEIYNNLIVTIIDVSSIMGLVSKSFMELYTTLKLLQAGYSQNDIANVFNIKSGRAYYLIKDAQTFSLSTLEEYVNQIIKLDYQVKKGLIDKSFGFEMFLLSI
jgi:hypothetical protein